jgi:hypothetical protein
MKSDLLKAKPHPNHEAIPIRLKYTVQVSDLSFSVFQSSRFLSLYLSDTMYVISTY